MMGVNWLPVKTTLWTHLVCDALLTLHVTQGEENGGNATIHTCGGAGVKETVRRVRVRDSFTLLNGYGKLYLNTAPGECIIPKCFKSGVSAHTFSVRGPGDGGDGVLKLTSRVRTAAHENPSYLTCFVLYTVKRLRGNWI